MSRVTIKRIRMHRFGDDLALAIHAVDTAGEQVKLPTLYLSSGLAGELRSHLLRFCADRLGNSFVNSQFGSHSIGEVPAE